jgi:hypothetical protein
MKMTDLTMNEIGMQELTLNEVDEVSGGVLCLLVLAFGAGYAVGTAIYKAVS